MKKRSAQSQKKRREWKKKKRSEVTHNQNKNQTYYHQRFFGHYGFPPRDAFLVCHSPQARVQRSIGGSLPKHKGAGVFQGKEKYEKIKQGRELLFAEEGGLSLQFLSLRKTSPLDAQEKVLVSGVHQNYRQYYLKKLFFLLGRRRLKFHF
jgi:hypothetical protein